MGRNKSQKSALIIAAIVILVCLVSITGATLALFTSNENDGKIGINATSGNLKIDIVDADDKNSLVNKVLQFADEDGLIEALFEPGATFHTEGFRIKNEGNIPINFFIYVSEDKTLSEDFYNAFEVFITNDLKSIENSETHLREFNGELKAGKSSDVYYLVFHMKETVGNEFQERTFSGVGITVCAVQGNVEFD